MVETSPISPSRLSEAVNTNYPDFSNNPFSSGLIGPAMDMAGTVGPGQFKEGQDPSKMLESGMQVMQQVMQQGLQAGSSLIGSFAGAAARAWDSSPAWRARHSAAWPPAAAPWAPTWGRHPSRRLVLPA